MMPVMKYLQTPHSLLKAMLCMYFLSRILLHISFLSPLLVLVLWVKPIARDFLANAPMGKTTVTL